MENAGTGKTTVLVECMLAEAAAGRRVLYCAASNIAVDNAVERLAAAAAPRVRARIVRVGHPARLLPEVLDHSLEAAVLRSDASALAADCRAEAAALGRRLLKLSGRRDAAERREVRGEMRRLAKEERARQGKAAGEVLRGAAITCCTLTGARAATLRGHEFDVVYIDEAAQAVEVACWGAMLRARRAVLAGVLPAGRCGPSRSPAMLGTFADAHVFPRYIPSGCVRTRAGGCASSCMLRRRTGFH